jgi:hypothetical protein
MNAIKLEKKPKPTKDDKKMIDTMRNMIQAYVALANKTFQQENNGETFDTLEEIKNHLKNSFPQQQLGEPMMTMMMRMTMTMTMMMTKLRIHVRIRTKLNT